MQKAVFILFMSSIVAMLLTGCSREPNQQELQSLYQIQIDRTNQLAEKLTQQQGRIIQVKNFEKIDCNKIGKSKDYQCRVNITVHLPFLGEQQNTTTLHVAQSEHGWVMVD